MSQTTSLAGICSISHIVATLASVMALTLQYRAYAKVLHWVLTATFSLFFSLKIDSAWKFHLQHFYTSTKLDKTIDNLYMSNSAAVTAALYVMRGLRLFGGKLI